jgi:hypothetical protein
MRKRALEKPDKLELASVTIKTHVLQDPQAQQEMLELMVNLEIQANRVLKVKQELILENQSCQRLTV